METVKHDAHKAFAELAESDRVHSRVYTDPAVFEDEQRHIFRRAWCFVAHESHVAAQGDCFATMLAGMPILVTRDTADRIHVLNNRCGHRGAQIVTARCRNARELRCPYHAWTYELDGRLKRIPRESGYADTAIKAADPAMAMAPLESSVYQGFVFARFETGGPDLTTWLGEASRALDNMVARAPAGTLRVVGPSLRVIQRNNWKIYLENLHDGMHPMVVHGSSVAAATAETSTSSSLTAEIIAANGQSFAELDKLDVRTYAHGHSDMRGFRDPANDDKIFTDYAAALTAARGHEAASATLDTNIHNACFYPSFSVHPSFMQLRVIQPLAVDRTLVEHWVLAMDGAPDEINRRNIVFANAVHAPSSMIKSDDLEVYRRVQAGALHDGWISNHRRGDRDADGFSSALSEQFIRNQYHAWRHYMKGDDLRDAG